MNTAEAWMCRMSKRSWWECMYANGDTLAEWGTLVNTLLTPFGAGTTSRWEEISKHQMVRLRLICPNGMIGELVSPWREGHKFFQLKVAIRSIGVAQSHVRSQIIGLVLNAEGDAMCRAWEMAPPRLIEFHDNIYRMSYEHIGCLSLDVQGLKL
jgi:hypothetical protein